VENSVEKAGMNQGMAREPEHFSGLHHPSSSAANAQIILFDVSPKVLTFGTVGIASRYA
jgi:hypothetical protein